MSVYSYCIHRASWHLSAALTEVSPCFFFRQIPGYKYPGITRKDGARPTLFQNFCVVLYIFCSVSFYVLFACKCVLCYCYRVAIQLKLTNILYYFIKLKDGNHDYSVASP